MLIPPLGEVVLPRSTAGIGGGFTPTTPNYPALLRGVALEQLPSPDESGLRFASRGKNFFKVLINF